MRSIYRRGHKTYYVQCKAETYIPAAQVKKELSLFLTHRWMSSSGIECVTKIRTQNSVSDLKLLVSSANHVLMLKFSPDIPDIWLKAMLFKHHLADMV